MRNKMNLLVAILVVLAMISCEGPEGPRGAQGPTGPAGQNGNEEVYLFTYGTQTLSAATYYMANYSFDTLSARTLNESVMIAYYADYVGEWNTANGAGPMGIYQTVQFYSEHDSTLHVYLLNGDGAGYSGSDVTWDSSRVYVIPPSMIRRAEALNMDLRKMEDMQQLTGK